MKVLIVEDDFVSGKLLKKILEKYGESEIASSGEKGVELFIQGLDSGEPYNLVCLDIMMPKMSGHDVLMRIREIEEEREMADSTRAIMTTALEDFDNIKRAYREQCEDYLIKPLHQTKVENSLKKLGLI